MNIVAQLNHRINEARTTNRTPCKNYKTEAVAERAAGVIARETADYFHCADPVRYVVFYNPDWKRWCVGLDFTELLRRKDAIGGYIGYAAARGFYCY